MYLYWKQLSTNMEIVPKSHYRLFMQIEPKISDVDTYFKI